MSRSSVDFPQPLGPTSETSSPAAMESDTPSSACGLCPVRPARKLLQIS